MGSDTSRKADDTVLGTSSFIVPAVLATHLMPSFWISTLTVFFIILFFAQLTKEYDKAYHTLENLRSSFGKHDPRQHALDSIGQVCYHLKTYIFAIIYI